MSEENICHLCKKPIDKASEDYLEAHENAKNHHPRGEVTLTHNTCFMKGLKEELHKVIDENF